MGLYDRVADLSVSIADVSVERHERETMKFTRATTVVSLSGEGETGQGEDVSYDADLHPAPAPDLSGEYTLAQFSAAVSDLDLFPEGDNDHPAYRNYRQWAFESAALDLGLRQADTDLGTELGREYDPVRFVFSPTLGDPPSADALHEWHERNPDLQFKLDAEDDWSADLVAELSEFGVRIVDFKALYEDADVAGSTNADLYERVVEGFPEAILEDAAWTDDTQPVLDAARDRISWDVPITSPESVRDLPFEPSWLNCKPSRFGSVESLLDTIDYCENHGIELYGGGQFELGVGRRQIHLVASLFYPESPNDTAPSAYNDPEPEDGLPRSPLEIGDVTGFR